MGNTRETLHLAASELPCAECRNTKQGKVSDPAAYSRGWFTFGDRGSKTQPLSVEVRVKRLTRTLEPETRIYRVSAVFDLRCPSCKATTERELTVGWLPVKIARELIICPSCGNKASLEVQKLDCVEVNASTDRFTLRGQLRCAKCTNAVELNARMNVDVKQAIELASHSVSDGSESTVELNPWGGTADLRVADSLAPLDVMPMEGSGQPCERPADVAYDVVFSFAGEDRDFVDQVAVQLQTMKVSVFYDRFETVDLWGKDLYQHLDRIYRRAARICVIFISKHYVRKRWTNQELRSAQARAFEQNQEYILPFRFDETEVPGLLPTIGYIESANKSAKNCAEIIVKKLDALGYR